MHAHAKDFMVLNTLYVINEKVKSMIDKEFANYIEDLLKDNRMTDRISAYPSHRVSDHVKKANPASRLDHCLRVAYMSYKCAKLLKLNKKKCCRAGFLHDCGYGTNESAGIQFLTHSFYSAEIARERKEWDVARIVESHMFPFGSVPNSVEAIVLWVVDKIDAILDFFHIAPSSTRLHLYWRLLVTHY